MCLGARFRDIDKIIEKGKKNGKKNDHCLPSQPLKEGRVEARRVEQVGVLLMNVPVKPQSGAALGSKWQEVRE